MQAKPTSHNARALVLVVVLALVVVACLNMQTLLDDYALLTFHPTAKVVAIENKLGLSQEARGEFYRAKPQIDDKASFNRDCDTQPHELELGCYYRGRIYILQIDNPSLASEMDVVAAHELLHAAWSNMSASERTQLGSELQTVYAAQADAELKQRMADYATTEVGEQTNELHSILATEFAQLTPALEKHYEKYFTNRAAIVAEHEAYQNVFDSQRAQLASELSQIKTEKAQLSTVNSQMSYYRSTQQIGAYNSLVPRQNSLVDDINSRIAIYQQGVDEYNALSKSLDSQQITETESAAR